MFIPFQLLIVLIAQAHSPNLDKYLKIKYSQQQQPITTQELKHAVLSPTGVDSIRRVFELSLSSAINLGEVTVLQGFGGEVTVHNNRLNLIHYPDPMHSLIQHIKPIKNDPIKLLSLLRNSVNGNLILNYSRPLNKLLGNYSTREQSEALIEQLDKYISHTIINYYQTWTLDPVTRVEAIEVTPWLGKYVGFWHSHPPRLIDSKLLPGEIPSSSDKLHASALGQFLTIVFQPTGFDLYDLSPYGSPTNSQEVQPQVIQYRDPAWQLGVEDRLLSLSGRN